MKYCKPIIVSVALILLDQFVKIFVDAKLSLYQSIPIIKDFFEIYYIRNEGAAWGMFQNKQFFFILATLVVLIITIIYYIRMIDNPKFSPIKVCLVFIFSGAIGNLIDRVFRGDKLFHGGVIDFLYLKFINFPIFNIADMYVSIGMFILILLILFRYKESDFKELSTKKQS